MVFLRPVVMRNAQAAMSCRWTRYEAIRAAQQAPRPTDKSPCCPTRHAGPGRAASRQQAGAN